jgi:hypothetical protein
MDLTRQDILDLLDELIAELIQDGVTGEIVVYGGSAVAYYHGERDVTRDVDSMYKPYAKIKKAAQAVAARHEGLDDNWFNMQIHDMMPPVPDDNPSVYYEDKGLTASFASQEYLLAMKANCSRRSEQDKQDAAMLYSALGLKSWLDIAAVVAKYYGEGNYGSQELFFEDIEDLAQELKSTAN